MSNHYDKAPGQEIDLTDIFLLIGRFFKGILYFFFKILDFIIKKWVIVLLLIVVGVVTGYLTEEGSYYKANLLVKTNFKSQSYVYTAIDQFNGNLEEKDRNFISSLNKDPETFSVKGVSIEPIVEAIDLINFIGENDKTLSEMTKEFKVEGNKDVFATDRFLSYSSFHRLEITLNKEDQLEDIETLLSFINDNPYARELKEVGIVSHKKFISSQEESMKQINDIIENTSQENGLKNNTVPDDGFYFNNREYDLEGLFDFKTKLTQHLEKYRYDNVSFKDVAVIVSDVQAYNKTSLFNNRIFIYPIVLVFLFILMAGIINAFRNYKLEINTI